MTAAWHAPTRVYALESFLVVLALSAASPSSPQATSAVSSTNVSTASVSPNTKHIAIVVTEDAPAFNFTYGVDHGPMCDSGVDVTRELQGFGSSLIRTHDSGVLDWPVIFPHPNLDVATDDPANYNFAPGDAYFRRIVASGFAPYFRLGTSWGQMGGGLPPAGVAYNQTALVQVMVRTVMHYNDGWAGGFTGKGVKYWEIWWVGRCECAFQLACVSMSGRPPL